MIVNSRVGEKATMYESEIKSSDDDIFADSTAEQLAEMFKVLGDPTRVKILHALGVEKMCVCDISTLLDISQSAVSHQLRVLRNLKVVKGQKRGRQVFYSLVDEHVKRLFREALEHVRE